MSKTGAGGTPDFRLVMGVDVSASVGTARYDISQIVNELNKKPPQIKVEIDDAATKIRSIISENRSKN